MVFRKTVFWLLLAAAVAVLPGTATAVNGIHKLEYVGDLFDAFGGTALCGKATLNGAGVPAQTLWFEGTNLSGVTFASPSFPTNILGVGCKSTSWSPNIYEVVVKMGDAQGPFVDSPVSDPVVLTIYRPVGYGLYLGGELRLFNYGSSPNVRRTIEPRTAYFGLIWEVGPHPWPVPPPPYLPRGMNEQFLFLDNHYPVDGPIAGIIEKYVPVRIWGKSFRNIRDTSIPGRQSLHIWTRGWFQIENGEPTWRYIEFDLSRTALPPPFVAPVTVDILVYDYPYSAIYRARSQLYNGGVAAMLP